MANLCGRGRSINIMKHLQRLVFRTNLNGCLQHLAQRGFITHSNQFYQYASRSFSVNNTNLIKCSTSLQKIISVDINERYNYYMQYRNNSNKNFTVDESSHTDAVKKPIDEFRAKEEQSDSEYFKKTDDSAPSEEETKNAKLDAIRTKILNAALEQVAVHGWTRKAIIEGSEVAGYPAVAHGIFPNGASELVEYFYSKCNDDLLNMLKAETNNGQNVVSDPLDFLIKAVKIRLQMILPFKHSWPQALAVMAQPKNVPKSLAQLLTLVDDICYYSGDRAVDFGWYTRRVGLATIYKIVELYMIQDTSADHQETWNFLKSRMEEASQLQTLLLQSEEVKHKFQRSFNSAFITARNILGVSYNRR